MPEIAALNIMTNAWYGRKAGRIGRYKDRLQIITSYDGAYFQDRARKPAPANGFDQYRILLDGAST